MKKRIVLLVVAVFMLGGASAFARGPLGMDAIGVYGSLGGSSTGATGGGLGITMKWGSFPVIGVQYYLGYSNVSIGLSADYMVLDDQKLAGSLGYFLGVGVFGGVYFGNTTTDFDLGLRPLLGLQLWIIPKLELYLSGIPMVHFIPAVTLNFCGELGLRVHF